MARHVVKALDMMREHESRSVGMPNPVGAYPTDFIRIENPRETPGVAPVVCMAIQSDPVPQVGYNGCQAEDMIRYSYFLIKSLNDAHPCKENQRTMDHLLLALHHQDVRTKDRVARGVEGKNIE